MRQIYNDHDTADLNNRLPDLFNFLPYRIAQTAEIKLSGHSYYAIGNVLIAEDNSDPRSGLVIAYLERVTGITWEKFAAEFIDALHRAISSIDYAQAGEYIDLDAAEATSEREILQGVLTYLKKNLISPDENDIPKISENVQTADIKADLNQVWKALDAIKYKPIKNTTAERGEYKLLFKIKGNKNGRQSNDLLTQIEKFYAEIANSLRSITTSTTSEESES